MRKLRLPAAAVAAITFVACYALTILIELLLDPQHAVLALVLVSLLVPGASLLAIWRTRRRDDLTPKQKAVTAGFLIGTAAGLPVAVLAMPSPIALLFLGLPTSALGVLFDATVLPTVLPHAVLQVLFFNPYVLFALNWALVGSAVGWTLVVTNEAPAGERWPLARRRVGLALACLLGPAIGFGAGMGLMYQYDNLEGWRTARVITGPPIASNESEAVSGLRAIWTAQHSYRSLNREKTFAPSLSRLQEGLTDWPGLMGRGLAQATYRARSGYLFMAIPLDGDGNHIDPRKEFAVCAFPTRYNRTGRNTFFVTSEGTIYQKDAVGPMTKLPGEDLSRWIVTSSE